MPYTSSVQLEVSKTFPTTLSSQFSFLFENFRLKWYEFVHLPYLLRNFELLH
uniref:Uncharacterized protein n=1 Tax=Solanum lycopersicum TaxID=4081 RepID=A0A3Q7EVP9_SOLLC